MFNGSIVIYWLLSKIIVLMRLSNNLTRNALDSIAARIKYTFCSSFELYAVDYIVNIYIYFYCSRQVFWIVTVDIMNTCAWSSNSWRKIYKRVPLLIQKTNSTSSMRARSKESTKQKKTKTHYSNVKKHKYLFGEVLHDELQ